MKYAFSSPFAVTEAFASPSADVRIGPVELLRLDGSRLTMKDHAAHRATAVLFLSTRCGASEAARETIRGLNRRRGILFAGVFPNPAENGNDVLAWNDQKNARPTLHLARSAADGKTWNRPPMLVSNPGEFSCPSVFQTRDGKTHVVCTCRRCTIEQVEYDEAWLILYEGAD